MEVGTKVIDVRGREQRHGVVAKITQPQDMTDKFAIIEWDDGTTELQAAVYLRLLSDGRAILDRRIDENEYIQDLEQNRVGRVFIPDLYDRVGVVWAATFKDLQERFTQVKEEFELLDTSVDDGDWLQKSPLLTWHEPHCLAWASEWSMWFYIP